MSSTVEAIHNHKTLPSFDEQTTNEMIERINLEADGRNGEYGSFVGKQLEDLRNMNRADIMINIATEQDATPKVEENEPIKVTEHTLTETKDNIASPPTERKREPHQRFSHDSKKESRHPQRNKIKNEPPSRNELKEPLQNPRVLVDEMTREIPSVPKLAISDATIKRLEEIWARLEQDEEDVLADFEQEFAAAARSEPSSRNDSMDIDELVSPKKKQQPSPAVAPIRLKIASLQPNTATPSSMNGSADIGEDDVSFDDSDVDDSMNRSEEVMQPRTTIQPKVKAPEQAVKVKIQTPPRQAIKKENYARANKWESKREDTRNRSTGVDDMLVEMDVKDTDTMRKSPVRRVVDRPTRIKQEQPKKRQPKVNQVIKEIGVPPAKLSVSEAPFKRKRSLSKNSAVSPERATKRRRTTPPRYDKNKTPSPAEDEEDTYDPFSAKPRHEHKPKQEHKPIRAIPRASTTQETAASLKQSADFWKHKADGQRSNKEPPKEFCNSYLLAMMKYIELFAFQDKSGQRATAQDCFRSLEGLANFTASQATAHNLREHTALAHLIRSFAYSRSFLLRRELLTSIDESSRKDKTNITETHKKKLMMGCQDVLRMMDSWDKAKRTYPALPVEDAFSLSLPVIKEFVEGKLNEMMSDRL